MALYELVFYLAIPIASVVAVYLLTRKKEPIKDKFYDYDNQTIEIDDKEHIRVCKSAFGKKLVEYRFEDVKTVYDVLYKGHSLSNNGPCLGQREAPGKGIYTWLSYSEVLEKVKYAGSALYHHITKGPNMTNIGIYSSNRPEWIIAEHACYSFSLTVVSLYDSYGKDSIKYILNHAEIKAIFIDSFKRLKNITEVLSEAPDLKLIVHFDKLDAEQNKSLENARKTVKIISFDEFMNIGKSNNYPHKPPKPSDVATICYTSGTTGVPKGAMITHLGIISNEAGLNERLHRPHINYTWKPLDVVHLSYLPLAHMLERETTIMILLNGGRIGFLSSDIQNLQSDAQALRPTEFPLVPRILNKLYEKVQNQTNVSKWKKILFELAFWAKLKEVKQGIYTKNTIFDYLVFNKIRQKFGGRFERLATGSAPISNDVMLFSRVIFGCPIMECYGQTEATCCVTSTHPFDPNIGHVGSPLVCYMVKLIDVPEMDYYANNKQGEICVKGPSQFKGYLKDEEKTAEAIDKDGWLHTGDIGTWLPNGALKIIDRKKNLFKLSQGEYISPEKIENVYLRSRFIAQVFVDGNSLKNHLVAIVVPEAEFLLDYAAKNQIDGDFKQLCNNKVIKETILQDITKFGKEAGLMSFEQVKNIHLHAELMSLENGLCTPTLKIKRHEARKYFQDVINKMYQD